jgi:uncharacterized membrane protein YuzA (DUF378 family)
MTDKLLALAGSLTGLVFGIAGALILLQLFSVVGDKPWVYHMAQVSTGLGVWMVREWDFGCFPTQAGVAKTNTLFVLAGGLQWGVVGLMFDLIRAALRRQAFSN